LIFRDRRVTGPGVEDLPGDWHTQQSACSLFIAVFSLVGPHGFLRGLSTCFFNSRLILCLCQVIAFTLRCLHRAKAALPSILQIYPLRALNLIALDHVGQRHDIREIVVAIDKDLQCELNRFTRSQIQVPDSTRLVRVHDELRTEEVLIALSTLSGFLAPTNNDGVVAHVRNVVDELGLVGAIAAMKSHTLEGERARVTWQQLSPCKVNGVKRASDFPYPD
jgi:hypothetical protein